jgi:hypothetical protein
MKGLLHSDSIWIAIVLIVAVIPNQPRAQSPSVTMRITPISYSANGVLALTVSFSADRLISLYDWGGHIYPLWGHSLHHSSITKDKRALSIKPAALIIPVFPHPADVVSTREHTYAKPLVLSVEEGGRPFIGCFRFSLQYDSSVIAGYDVGLTKLVVDSNQIEVCNHRL